MILDFPMLYTMYAHNTGEKDWVRLAGWGWMIKYGFSFLFFFLTLPFSIFIGRASGGGGGLEGVELFSALFP